MTIQVTACRTEYETNPVGLDERKPRLFWRLESDRRNARQTAYQILVSSTRERISREEGDLWDSGRVESGESTHIAYEGKALLSDTAYWWKVRVWDEDNQASEWSETASWAMGILERGEWKAKWIGRKAKPDLELQPSLTCVRNSRFVKDFGGRWSMQRRSDCFS
ncbi:hypothetical protein N6H14_28040 [Paenibacillus sp. CC-CFT747]|nr:hypothetical protein N6H14_28040 [Paenibacillus sp. CC-CFT747]